MPLPDVLSNKARPNDMRRFKKFDTLHRITWEGLKIMIKKLIINMG